MPLSRLTPRNRQKKAVTRSRTHRREPGPNSRHLQLLTAIRRTREELDRWQSQMALVDTLFRTHILPREQSLTKQFCALTGLLMDHFANQNLSPGDQSLIGLWIIENLESLNDHPFVSAEQHDALRKRWELLLSRDGYIEQQLTKMSRHLGSHDGNARVPDRQTDTNAGGGTTSEDLDEEEIVFDFGWHKKEEIKPAASTHTHRKKENKAGSDASNQRKQADTPDAGVNPSPEQIKHTVESLEQRLSVDRLFRQLARVLHPDREQDEQLKADKHELMSRCLKARQEKDINTLLSLYCEHVGELPGDLADDSHETLINALKLQLEQLQLELRNRRFGDPLLNQIVERYSGPSQAVTQERIDQHLKSLDMEILHTKALSKSLSNPEGLSSSLKERRAVEYDRLAIDEMTGLS